MEHNFAKAKSVYIDYSHSIENKYLFHNTTIVKRNFSLEVLLFQGILKLLHSKMAAVIPFPYPRAFYFYSPIVEGVLFLSIFRIVRNKELAMTKCNIYHRLST